MSFTSPTMNGGGAGGGEAMASEAPTTERVLARAPVRFKKQPWDLYFTTQRLVFNPSANNTHSEPTIVMLSLVAGFVANKPNPAKSNRALIKLTYREHASEDSRERVIEFTSPTQAWEDQHTILGLLKNYAGDAAEERQAKRQRALQEAAKDRAEFLASNKEMKDRYERLVTRSKCLTAEEFWDRYRLELHLHKQAIRKGDEGIHASLPVPINLPSQIANPQQGDKGIFNITPETQREVFEQNPKVRAAYERLVPTSLSEKEFWTKYFQSGYYYNSQGREKPKNVPNDPLFDAMEKTAEEVGPDAWTAESMVNPEVDLTQAEVSTGHGEHSVEIQPLPGDAFASNNTFQSLLHRFNSQSGKATGSFPKAEPTKSSVDVESVAKRRKLALDSSESAEIADLRNSEGDGNNARALAINKLMARYATNGSSAVSAAAGITKTDALDDKCMGWVDELSKEGCPPLLSSHEVLTKVDQETIELSKELVHLVGPGGSVSGAGLVVPGVRIWENDVMTAGGQSRVDHGAINARTNPGSKLYRRMADSSVNVELDQLLERVRELLSHFWASGTSPQQAQKRERVLKVLLAEKDAMESWMTRTPPEWHATCRYVKEAVEEAHRDPSSLMAPNSVSTSKPTSFGNDLFGYLVHLATLYQRPPGAPVVPGSNSHQLGNLFEELYKDPAVVAYVYGRLSGIGKVFINRLILVHRPIQQGVIRHWISSLHDPDHSKYRTALAQLTKLHILIMDPKGQHLRMSSNFRQRLHEVILKNTADDQLTPSWEILEESKLDAPIDSKVEDGDPREAIMNRLDEYAALRWEYVLGAMVDGMTAAVGEASLRPEGARQGLSGIVGMSSSNTSTGQLFQFVLASRTSQYWELVRRAFDMIERQHGIQSLLAPIRLVVALTRPLKHEPDRLTPGTLLRVNPQCMATPGAREAVTTLLETLADLGIMVPATYDDELRKVASLHSQYGESVKYELPLVSSDSRMVVSSSIYVMQSSRSKLAAEDNSAISNKSCRLFVDSNFAVTAYTTSSLDLRLLGTFVQLQRQLGDGREYDPNDFGCVIGTLTQTSVQSAAQRGVTSEYIISYLKSHVDPRALQMASQSGRGTAAATTVTANTGAARGEKFINGIPANVIAQITLWEKEAIHNRLRIDPGVALQNPGATSAMNQFTGMTQSEEAAKFVTRMMQSCGPSACLWSRAISKRQHHGDTDPQSQTIVVSERAAKRFKLIPPPSSSASSDSDF
ncbi:hypothetical protein FOL47_005348 [Perkinsus chesapeaki]|uniref:General transcription factor IIH subunit 4 n=1 Tax=Perkinsus chesapeaki TaxID=330153 RepID=A0A7J6N3P6_PERCH|nr:hypothetical protein FOL47_005348 [Perkinsus chesapeaki]